MAQVTDATIGHLGELTPSWEPPPASDPGSPRLSDPPVTSLLTKRPLSDKIPARVGSKGGRRARCFLTVARLGSRRDLGSPRSVAETRDVLTVQEQSRRRARAGRVVRRSRCKPWDEVISTRHTYGTRTGVASKKMVTRSTTRTGLSGQTDRASWLVATPETVTPVMLGLLEGFELRQGGTAVVLPLTAQRVLAFLALRRRAVPRAYVAGVLWPDTDETMARASLRSALWRLHRECPVAVETSGHHLSLGPSVFVDVHDVTAVVRRGMRADADERSLSLLCQTLSAELLPGWYEDWVLVERESLRQQNLHALERSCQRLAATGRYAQAIEAGLRAVAMEPLRESAQMALMEAHLAEGNQGEALRQYHAYCELLQDSLGIDPSPRIRRFISSMKEPTTME